AGPGAAVAGLTTGTGPAVEGVTWGSGSAIVAQIVSPANRRPAISASTSGPGAAVQASGTGTGGRGVVASGAAAPLQLTPGSASTHPTAGQTGDLYVDASARLWYCRSGGTTATWAQLA
ncbi:MAG TPA: hypothetical protein VMT43_03555, partial [Acidimicrobiales bacterium]|nr:hypothetical protein [Acidimicrobiales bacterium]